MKHIIKDYRINREKLKRYHKDYRKAAPINLYSTVGYLVLLGIFTFAATSFLTPKGNILLFVFFFGIFALFFNTISQAEKTRYYILRRMEEIDNKEDL